MKKKQIMSQEDRVQFLAKLGQAGSAVCETMELLGPAKACVPQLYPDASAGHPRGCHLLQPPRGSDTAFVNIHMMLMNSVELCVHREVPGFTRPQITRSVAMLTNMFTVRSKCFLTLFSIFPRNAGGDEIGKMVFSSHINIFFHFIKLIPMKKVTYLKFKPMEEQFPDMSA